MGLRPCRARVCLSIALLALSMLGPRVRAANAIAPVSVARQSPEWLRDAVVYEVFPRAFSASGDFKGVTAQLDRLKELGVTVLWRVPGDHAGKPAAHRRASRRVPRALGVQGFQQGLPVNTYACGLPAADAANILAREGSNEWVSLGNRAHGARSNYK